MTKFKNKISPSLLSADFSDLAAQIAEVTKGGADELHLDVMDGHFVPNLTFGPVLVGSIRPRTKMFLDCHLMVSNPHEWIEAFAKAGADGITIHAESTPHLDRAIGQIRAQKKRVGVALNPGSSIALIEEVLADVDLVLVMTVNPGFGGQKFIQSQLDKISRLSQMRAQDPQLKFEIQVDGGIDLNWAPLCVESGASNLVAGSSIFGQKDPKKAVLELRKSTSH